jgi:2-amino-4-hydroxy-6-hydroxymethyldihydropteridine diphosphokinase
VWDQSWFANQVARLYCSPDWSAHGLLRALLAIEENLGRVRLQNKGHRLIDLDLLLFDAQCIHTPELILPHPRMERRAFVLIPLLDIAPDLAFPDGRSLREALNRLSYTQAKREILQP